ncbi:hypothetical protein [Dyadobacter sp. BHUBP1]|uniref:hypothetical protein n=1 Tax=Dyadobacter sp. BHUBP1 TaxID=3424178 RepID=UPI003D338C45
MTKGIFISIILMGIVLNGCGWKTPEGARANPEANKSNGYWHLTSLYKQNKEVDISKADSAAYLKVSSHTKYDSAFNSRAMYYLFASYSNTFKETGSMDASSWDYSTNNKKSTETQWFRISPKKGFQITFYLNEANNPASGMVNLSHRMDISNVMESEVYRPELDTVRYVYTQADKFL